MHLAQAQAQITVHPPQTKKQLSRYRKTKGIFVIRSQEREVLYIGASSNLYFAISRLFQSQGVLAAFDSKKMHYELIQTQLRTPCIKSILQRHFKPRYNKRIQPLTCLNKRQKKRAEVILKAYLSMSRFTEPKVIGEHRTDSFTTYQ